MTEEQLGQAMLAAARRDGQAPKPPKLPLAQVFEENVARVREAIEVRGLSQRAAAADLKLSESTVYRACRERGIRRAA